MRETKLQKNKDMVDEECKAIKKKFGDKEFLKLDRLQRLALLEHYHRCDQFWRHFTTTIWSLPTVASAINIGVYAIVFTGTVENNGEIIALGILMLLNFILTLGIWKHQNMQKRFGHRIRGIEKYASIEELELGREKWSGSTAYFIAMIFLTITSVILYSISLISEFPELIQAIPLTIPAIGFLVILVYVLIGLNVRGGDNKN